MLKYDAAILEFMILNFVFFKTEKGIFLKSEWEILLQTQVIILKTNKQKDEDPKKHNFIQAQ